MEGCRVVQISDLHRGCGANTDSLIKSTVEITNSLDPDYIWITGDFVDEEKKDIEPVIEMLTPLKAKRGIYGILGNHDHRSDPDKLVQMLEQRGIVMLQNRHVILEQGLWLGGVDDILEGKGDIQTVLKTIPANTPAVFLCHNPNGFNKIKSAPPLWMLSGHTHGAQIAVKFPNPWMVCRIHLHTKYISGWYRSNGSILYVNRGIGVTGWGPFVYRYNCPPEITVFTLKAN